MEVVVKGNIMTITCPLSDGTTSRSGKTLVVATTSGFQPVAGTDYRVSLNVIKARK